MLRKEFYLLIFLALFSTANAQKVGLVLSGGGAKGLAHVGVLMALEDNDIPIDYITGTSFGGIVGGLYAAGYSPSELEYVAQSQNFQSWVSGSFKSDYSFFYQRKPNNPSIGSVNLGIDSGFQARLNTNLINDIPLNFGLLELASQATVNSGMDFDSLYVPFRCMIADVFSQEQIALKSGSLSEALRATLTVPYVYRPIKINDRYVFDGGLYNNFPVDVMQEEFKPDIIISVNVSSKNFKDYPFSTDEELLAKLFNYLLLSKSDSNLLSEKDIYIEPNLQQYSTIDFKNVNELIAIGYEAAMSKMPEIKAAIERRESRAQKKIARNKFIDKKPIVEFNALSFSGINNRQKVYVRNVMGQKYNKISMMDMKKGYYKLVSDPNFNTVYPKLQSGKNGVYDFDLEVKADNTIRAEIGGNISSRPINTFFIGLNYNYLNAYSLTSNVSAYFGRFYESGAFQIRLDYPTRIPVFFDLSFVYNHWDFFKSSDLVIQDPIVNFVDQTDRMLIASAGIPGRNNGRWRMRFGGLNTRDLLSQTNNFQEGDTLDQSIFNAFKYVLEYENSTLNEKQFADKGTQFKVSLQYHDGKEKYLPGSESIVNARLVAHSWFRANIYYTRYLSITPKYHIGLHADIVASNQPLFASYRSSILAAPGFTSMLDARTFLFDNYRAFSFATLGIRNVYHLRKNLQARLELYVFQPYQKIASDGMQKARLEKAFKYAYPAGIASVVYKTPIGPLSLNTSYYANTENKWSVMFNMGYLIFQNRATD